MNLVCLDTPYFSWGLLLKATPGREDRIQQATEFFSLLDSMDSTIVVPTPIVTELLMGADPTERHKILTELENKFRVAEFDLLSAKFAADIWNTKKASGAIDEITKSGASLRTKIKIDTQILAIAMATNVTVLYTEDENLSKLADGFMVTRKMPVQLQGDLFSQPTSPIVSAPPSVQSGNAQQSKVSPPSLSLPSIPPTAPTPPPPDSSPSAPTSPATPAQ